MAPGAALWSDTGSEFESEALLPIVSRNNSDSEWNELSEQFIFIIIITVLWTKVKKRQFIFPDYLCTG